MSAGRGRAPRPAAAAGSRNAGRCPRPRAVRAAIRDSPVAVAHGTVTKSNPVAVAHRTVTKSNHKRYNSR